MAPQPELQAAMGVLGVLLIFFALTQGHQQKILGMSEQTEAASIVFTKGRGGSGISVKG